MFIAVTLLIIGTQWWARKDPSTVKWDRKHTNNKYTKVLISEIDQFNGRN